MLIHLNFVCDYLGTKTAKLSNNRGHMAYKIQNIYYLAFHKKSWLTHELGSKHFEDITMLHLSL